MEEINNEYVFDDEYQISTQKKFLSLLVLDREWSKLSGIDLIRPEYFESIRLKNICTWIHRYYKQYKELPSDLVLKEEVTKFINDKGLSEKEYYNYDTIINEIFAIENKKDLDFFKDKAIGFIRQVAWKKALAKGGDALKLNNFNEAINTFKEALHVGANTDLGMDSKKLSPTDLLNNLREAYDPKEMIKTGIPAWDAALGGGFVKNNLHLIAASPGSGKSRTMAFLTKQALMDFKRVVFITLELTEEETYANIASAITGLTMHDMLCKENEEEFTEKFVNFNEQYNSDLFVKFYRPGTTNADTVDNYIQQIIRDREHAGIKNWKPDVIFLDYMDKMIPTQKVKGNTYEDIGGIANDCKNLAITYGCPVITGSQLGRISWTINNSEVISMDNIAESAMKVHLAHSMTTLNANPGEKLMSKVRLYLAKSRSGKPGQVIYCEQELGKCLMYETTPWDPAELQAEAGFAVKSTGGSSKK